MFGLTKREQRWKAEQKAAETIASVLVAAVNAKSHKGEKMNKAEQLIACLEGEIAKRDARIADLEHRCGMYGLELTNEVERRLQAERKLAAIKAQEPVAFAFRYDDGSWHDVSATQHSAGMVSLYAAPVVNRKLTTECKRCLGTARVDIGTVCDNWVDCPECAAPAAPAADALVEALEVFASVMPENGWPKDYDGWRKVEIAADKAREALSAHRAKGVV